jgi:hypothetical protein
MLDPTRHFAKTPQPWCGEGPSKNVILNCIDSTQHTAKSTTFKKNQGNVESVTMCVGILPEPVFFMTTNFGLGFHSGCQVGQMTPGIWTV